MTILLRRLPILSGGKPHNPFKIHHTKVIITRVGDATKLTNPAPTLAFQRFTGGLHRRNCLSRVPFTVLWETSHVHVLPFSS